MKKCSFINGLIAGVIVGAVAKVVVDNKEEIADFAVNTIRNAKEEVTDFVDYAQARMLMAKEDIEMEFEEIREDINDLKEEFEILEDLSNDEDGYVVIM
ncbi:MAG: hypothetical protein IKM61_04480 [Eubacteriaceae bacterium]|nr:hypothetical protein [Eubacteriaceae bacterium]